MFKPYYEEKGITIYHGDCREILPTLSNVDLVLTDPPYGLGEKMWDTNEKTPKRRWRLHHNQMSWDNEVVDVHPIIEMCNKAIIWGGHLMDLPPQRCWLVWNKIVRNFSSGVCELAWTNLDAPIDAFDYSHGELAIEGKLHPTQKPVPLMTWCIKKTAANLILDPFMGSGTTLRAAKDLGRQAIGIEIEEKYCEIAVKRLKQEVFDFNIPAKAEKAEQECLMMTQQ